MVRRPPISTLTDTRFPYTPLFLSVPIGKITSDIRQMASEISRSGQFSANLDAESLGAAVRRSRKSHGLTQSQLAGLAGTGLRFVSELERGKANVALNKVLAVLAVLGLRLRAVEVDS